MQDSERLYKDKQLLMDAAAGAVAGAAAVWVMDQVSQYMLDHENEQARRQEAEARPEGDPDPAHKLVQEVAEATGTQVEPQQPSALGVGLHYLLGMGPGAVYGILGHRSKLVGSTYGLGYGLILFLLQDEAINTMLKTAGKPSEYPKQAHFRGLVAHLALGYTTDRLLRFFDRHLRR